jgi:GDP-L-fucose synthase
VSRILVTGGQGFLGGHVVRRFEAEGYDVIAPSKENTDLTDIDAVGTLFSAIRPEVVVHLAAEVGGIGANQKNPGLFWYANLMMGLNVLEQARLAHIRKVVIVGTICAYPKLAPIPFREEELWNGYPEETNAPYGIAKKALLVGAQAYREQYGLNAIYVLPVNLYGPGDHFDLENSHVIAALIRKMTDAAKEGADTVTLWGDGTPTREFLYASDCAEALLLATQRYDEADPVNLGSGLEVSIDNLASMIADLVGFKGEIAWDTTRPNGQPRRRLDVSRAYDRFGFEASTPLLEGLRATVEWYQANKEES